MKYSRVEMDQPSKTKCTLRVRLKSFTTIFQMSLILCSNVESLDMSQCTMPLGMESGEISDSDISASSSFENGNVGPFLGRKNGENQGGAWCPKHQITSEAEEWLQIDLHTTRVITMTETQGRFGNGQGLEFAETYLVSYWRPELNRWVRYRDHAGNEILKGNINTYLAAKSELNPPIIASKIRIIPYSYHRRTVCMRVEIYGCLYVGLDNAETLFGPHFITLVQNYDKHMQEQFLDRLEVSYFMGDLGHAEQSPLATLPTMLTQIGHRGIRSYSVPQGSKRGETWELYDHTYDGQWEGQYLQFGLGQLTDGKGGPIDFKDDYYAEHGKGWVGWKNESRNGTDPLEILFNFDTVREFNAVHIHTSNQFTKEIQVFSEARILFSVGGVLYPGDFIRYVPLEDCIFEDPKNISIKLHHRIGQHVKIQLFWASKWILISEISFESQPAMGNFTEEGIVVGNNSTKDTFNSRNDVSRVLIDNPAELPINVANPIVDRTPTLVEEFSSTTVVVTAVISSCIAILLVLVMILVAFLLRNRLFIQEKIPPPSHSCSVHYGDMGFNNGAAFGGCHNDFGYAAPLVLLASRDPKSKSPPTIASSLSRDYEPSNKPAFSSFVGSNANNIGKPCVGSVSSSSGNSKTVEYYSCTLLPGSTFVNKTDLMTNEYEYVSKEEDYFGLAPTSQKSPRRPISPKESSYSPPPMFNDRSYRNIALRLKELGLPEIPKQNLTLLRKIGQGVFGTMFIGELRGLSDPLDRQLVTVKRLLRNASEKDKLDFLKEVGLLSSLCDPNVTSVLGLCTQEEPFSVALEFLELGDLCQFLRQNDDKLHSASKRKLSDGDLLHLGSQIASGMKFLECKNIVHRDLGTRNCVVSTGLTVKISHFATDTGLYTQDYYQIDGKIPLPIRWMAWESVFMGKYSIKSDVWSMGVTLWEIFTFCQQSPYPSFTDQEVIHNLRRLSFDDDSDPLESFEMLNHPYNCPRDIYELMCDTWRRNDEERPSFWEIHCFLMRKNMNYRNTPQQRTTSNPTLYQTSYYV